MIPLSFKNGVGLSGLTTQSVLAVMVAWGIYAQLGADQLVITSVNDSNHSRKSKHWIGNAFDIRIWNLPEEHRQAAVQCIAEALGADYDVVFEKDHIHIEYDPKK